MQVLRCLGDPSAEIACVERANVGDVQIWLLVIIGHPAHGHGSVYCNCRRKQVEA